MYLILKGRVKMALGQWFASLSFLAIMFHCTGNYDHCWKF